MKKYDIGIIGCGVAGMTAAIYLKRAGFSCIIFEGSVPGGQIISNGNIENYPGFSSIKGTDLALSILNQVLALKIDIIYSKVKDILLQDGKKQIVSEKETVLVDKIILATGRIPRMLGVPGEEKFRAKGISYCAVCDGALYKDKNVIVIGGGDSAIEATIYLSNLVKQVTLIHRKDTYRAKKYLLDRMKELENIHYLKGEVKEFRGKDKLEKVILKDGEELSIDGAFIMIGQVPNTKFYESLSLELDDNYFAVDENYETSIKGIYAIGDCIKKESYQIVIAMGEAAKCAIHISKESSHHE